MRDPLRSTRFAIPSEGSPELSTFDVIVLGGGPAGYVCAIRAAQLGFATAVVEKDKLGGVCVNIGCIPTKALLHSAWALNLVSHDAKALGIEVGAVKGDYGVAMKRSRQVSDQNSKGVEFLMKKNKITVVKGEGVLQPGKKGKVGAGAVGSEFADIFNAFGTKITLIEALPRILPIEDAEASDVLTKSYRKRGITVLAGARVLKAAVGAREVSLEVDVGGKTEKVTVEKVLMAAGRAVNTEGMGFKESGVQLTDRGFVKVNLATLETTAPGVYCIGDVAGPPMLAHKGSREGVFVAELLAGRKPHPIKYDNVPSVTYCHPEVASIGLTEEQVRDKKIDYQVGRFPMSANGRARASMETEGFVKIIREKKYGEILGAHIVASHASEMIHELGVARENEYTVEEVELFIHAHPTLSEATAQAALDSMGRATDI